MSNNSLYPASSPYYATGVVNNRFLDVLVDRSIPKLGSDRYWEITTTYNLRPDMLAYDLYANPKLWWVFASRNPNALADPFFDFTTGTSIYLPEASTLKQVLGI
jgi:hypothetical protein